MISTEIRNALLLADSIRLPSPDPDDVRLARFVVMGIASVIGDTSNTYEHATPTELADIIERVAARAQIAVDHEQFIQKQMECN